MKALKPSAKTHKPNTTMKTKLIRSTLLGIAALSTLALVSCQAPAKCHMPTSAVTCSKCHTIHFNAPGTGVGAAGAKGGIVTMRHADSMSCADCESKVVAMLKTGNITQHTCKTCGGTLHHCSTH